MKSSILLVISVLTAGVIGKEAPIVSTKSGEVLGIVEKSFESNDYFSYKGIPFAEPPTGNVRFRPPVDRKPWEGILDGTVDGPPCIQLNQFNESIIVGSEDCLRLNVYTPEVPISTTGNNQKLRAVLVYIHGGRWLVGTASSKAYSPMYLMDQDLVVVTIQYRLGALGFLSTNDAVAPGNYGLLDQVKALEWIQANIAAFGGDPNRVTVSGQSAGGASTHMHLFSPLSRGLLHGAISLSGSAINYWANRFEDQLAEYAKRTGVEVGCPTRSSDELIECLRTTDAKKLTMTQTSLHDFFGGTPSKLPLSPYSPRVDAESERPFLSSSSLEMIRNGDVNPIPLMIGVTSQEGSWMIASFYGEDEQTRIKVFEDNLSKCVSSLTGNYFPKEVIEKIIEFYGLRDKPLTDLSQRIPLSELLSDLAFNFELFMAAYFHARQSSAPVFINRFDFRGEWSFAHEFEETKHDYEGVAHVDDLRYVFKLSFGPDLSTEEIEVMKRYTGYFAEFAKFGQPTHGNSSAHYNYYWRPYGKENGQYMVTDVPIRSGMSRDLPFESSSRPGRMEFWRQIFKYPENVADDFSTTTTHSEL